MQDYDQMAYVLRHMQADGGRAIKRRLGYGYDWHANGAHLPARAVAQLVGNGALSEYQDVARVIALPAWFAR